MSSRFEDRSEQVLREILSKLQNVVQDTVDDIQERAIESAREDTSPDADDIVLKESIKQEVAGLTGVVYVEGAAQAYALKQEFGDLDHPRYGFTPYMRPAVFSMQNIFLERVKAAMQ